ncbi:Stromalin [Carabus blaptoides fortunei]
MDVDNNSAHSAQSSEYDISHHSFELETNVKKTGNAVWKALSPKYKDRLYYKILKTSDPKGLVTTWINSYTLDNDKAIIDLLQLFIDLCSYQHINLHNYLEHHELTEVVPRMESSLSAALKETGKYLLKVRQKTFTDKHLKIEQFIAIWIHISAMDTILFDCIMIVKCLKFLIYMAKSKLKSIRHTGTFLGVKIQTALIRLNSKMTKKIQQYREQLLNETNTNRANLLENKLANVLSRYEHVNKLIEVLHINIYTENYCFLDSQLFTMRQDCVSEIYYWVNYFPDRYLQNNSISYVTKSITDPHKLVRYTAVKILSDILETYHIQLEKKLPKYITVISGRIQDIDHKIAILAIDSLTKISTYTKIPPSIRDIILQRIYSNQYPLAEAAGRFLVQSIKLHDVNDDIKILYMLVQFEIVSNKDQKFSGLYPLLVEAVFDDMPMLQDINVYMSVLQRFELDELERKMFLNILTESVYQTYTGNCSLVRKFARKGNVCEIKSAQLTKDLLAVLPRLVEIYPLDTLQPLLVIIKKYKV